MLTMLKAVKDNMEFTFTPVSRSDDRVVVEMYSTSYALIRNAEGQWSNAVTNKFEMSRPLIEAILRTLKIQ